MSVILLVRHGQASFGSADYDRLSPLGELQSRMTGAALANRGVAPALIVVGTRLRHRQTATHAIEAAGWTAQVHSDEGWDEFDHRRVLAAQGTPEPTATTDSREFQRALDGAAARWLGGEHDDDYPESFRAFSGRVYASLAALADRLGAGETGVVFTSSGAIAASATTLLGGSPQQWLRFNGVGVNAGITKVVVGGSGVSLVSFNDHAHVEPESVTYR